MVKFYSGKIIFFNKSLGLHEGIPSYKRSLQSSKENIQYFKTIIFFWFTSLGLYEGIPSYMRSLQSSKENIQYFKTIIFFCSLHRNRNSVSAFVTIFKIIAFYDTKKYRIFHKR